MIEPQTTPHEIVRLLVEELSDPGREHVMWDSYGSRLAETFHLSLPLRRMALEWVEANPRVTIGDLADGAF